MVEVGLTMVQLGLIIGENGVGAGVGRWDGGGRVDYATAEVDDW